MMDVQCAREEVIEACKWLQNNQYVFGTWGNISLRLDDGNILITPSKVPYDTMRPDDLVVLAPDGSVVSGHRLATSERELHRGIMNARADVGAIIHFHSTFAMAAAATGEDIPPLSEEMCQLIGGSIPITKHFVASEKHLELGMEATRCIGQKNGLLLRNHGPVACGRTLDEAKVCCQVIEKSAQMYLMLRNSSFFPVEEQWVEAGRNYFLYGYGKT